MIRINLFIIILLTIIGSTQWLAAQSLPDSIASKIDLLFSTWNTTHTPGAVIGVVHQGKLIYQQAYGMADAERKEKLSTTHAFWVASVSKQFTAMSIALLAEQGKLHLEDDIRKYLPELPFMGDTIRVKHLLYHTSGLRDGFTLIGLTFKGEKNYTNENS